MVSSSFSGLIDTEHVLANAHTLRLRIHTSAKSYTRTVHTCYSFELAAETETIFVCTPPLYISVYFHPTL